MQVHRYRPSLEILIISLGGFLLFFIVALFVFYEGGAEGSIFPFIITNSIILSPFIYISFFWFYYRKNQKRIIICKKNICIPYRWKNKNHQFTPEDIIGINKDDDQIRIHIRNKRNLIIIKKSWLINKDEFELLFKNLTQDFTKKEESFMIYWTKDTPYNFTTNYNFRDIYIEYKNITSMFINTKQGYPLIGQLWIKQQKYSKDYFSGPLLWDNKSYIYLPYFEDPYFILARINLETHEMNLIGDPHEVICLDRIENDHIYFYNDAFGENTLKSYDLKDQSLYQPFEINTKGLKKQE